jgi:DNA polymerase-3 subunit chi
MTVNMQIQFYHLTTTPLERALPKLVEKAYGAGYRVQLVLESEERVDYINQLLWTYDPNQFLPHGSARDAAPARQPIFLATTPDAPNNANILFVTEGTPAPPDAGYERVIDLFDGSNEDTVARARARWKTYKDGGYEISYFKQNDKGGWEKAA